MIDLPDPQIELEILEVDGENEQASESVFALEIEETLPKAEPYRVEDWCGKPNYKCPYCSFSTLSGSGAIELHILAEIDRGVKVRHLQALEHVEEVR